MAEVCTTGIHSLMMLENKTKTWKYEENTGKELK
jgi:hypothetical protein